SQARAKLDETVERVGDRDGEGVAPDIGVRRGKRRARGDQYVGGISEITQILNPLEGAGGFGVIEVDGDHLVGGWTPGEQRAGGNKIQFFIPSQRPASPIGLAGR